MSSGRWRRALEKLDDLQNEWAIVAATPVMAASALFCMFDHFAPWSRILAGVVFLILIASVALHGLWRLRSRLAPIAAIVLFIWSGALFVTTPLELAFSWKVLGSIVGSGSPVPGIVSLATVAVPLLVAFYVTGWVIDRPPRPASRVASADR